MGPVSAELLTQQLALNLPAGTTVHLVTYGTATLQQLVPFMESHLEQLGDDTIHLGVLVWSGNDFTTGAGKTNSGVRKARPFVNNLSLIHI